MSRRDADIDPDKMLDVFNYLDEVFLVIDLFLEKITSVRDFCSFPLVAHQQKKHLPSL